MSTRLEALRRRLDDRTATIGVAGLGYVGLPLAIERARAGFRVEHVRFVFDTRNATRGARHGRAKGVRL